MNSILNTSEIVGTVELAQGEFEVCASADATYNQSSSALSVQLDAKLRPCGAGDKASDVHVEWIPRRQIVNEHVAIEEAGEVARDVFKRWVQKVRECAPSLRAPTF
jgi:hypothetical protein